MPDAVPPPSPRPRRVVLLGHPVAHSLSPTFQNAALARAGIPLRYETLDTPPAALAPLLDEVRAGRWAGNVTVPHKHAVADACDVLTPLARAAGAVNTFWCADGALIGDNTDVAGAEVAVRELLGARAPGRDTSGVLRVALIGAGGAAAALVRAISTGWPDARVVVWSRRPAQADALAARFAAHAEVAAALGAALGGADLVVNATPLGLGVADPLPCPIAALDLGAAVFDMVYGPDETRWVREARIAGHAARDGLTMLVEQGAHAFQRWFRHAPDRESMWDAVETQTGRTRAGAGA